MLSYRITIDLDIPKEERGTAKEVKHLAKASVILWFAGFKKWSARKSPSGNGWHIIGWREQPITERELFEIRKEAGDDEKRINWDKKKNRAIQVLFKVKRFLKIQI